MLLTINSGASESSMNQPGTSINNLQPTLVKNEMKIGSVDILTQLNLTY